MNKHTAGPWGLDAGPHQVPSVYAGHDLVPADAPLAPYVHIADMRQDDSWEEMLANAALIAAAPSLLEACRAYIEAWDGVADVKKMDRALALTRAAITKAAPAPGTPCPNCGGGGIDTITDDVGSTIVQTCEDCLGTGRLPA